MYVFRFILLFVTRQESITLHICCLPTKMACMPKHSQLESVVSYITFYQNNTEFSTVKRFVVEKISANMWLCCNQSDEIFQRMYLHRSNSRFLLLNHCTCLVRLPSVPFEHQLLIRNRPLVIPPSPSGLIPEMPRVRGPICSSLWCNCTVQGLQM